MTERSLRKGEEMKYNELTGTLASSITYRPPKPVLSSVNIHREATDEVELTVNFICEDIINDL